MIILVEAHQTCLLVYRNSSRNEKRLNGLPGEEAHLQGVAGMAEDHHPGMMDAQEGGEDGDKEDFQTGIIEDLKNLMMPDKIAHTALIIMTGVMIQIVAEENETVAEVVVGEIAMKKIDLDVLMKIEEAGMMIAGVIVMTIEEVHDTMTIEEIDMIRDVMMIIGETAMMTIKGVDMKTIEGVDMKTIEGVDMMKIKAIDMMKIKAIDMRTIEVVVMVIIEMIPETEITEEAVLKTMIMEIGIRIRAVEEIHPLVVTIELIISLIERHQMEILKVKLSM